MIHNNTGRFDCDGVLNGEDEDVDGDGAMGEEDCDDTDPLSTIYLTDMDCDGILDTVDEDIDGDGILGVDDCDDGNPDQPSYQKT